MILGDRLAATRRTVRLHVDTDKYTTLADIDVDFRCLMPLLGREELAQHATLRMTLTCRTKRGVHEEQAIVSVSDLQKRLFLLLSNVMEQWPIKMSHSRTKELPQIQMDSHGEFHSASYEPYEDEAGCYWPY